MRAICAKCALYARHMRGTRCNVCALYAGCEMTCGVTYSAQQNARYMRKMLAICEPYARYTDVFGKRALRAISAPHAR